MWTEYRNGKILANFALPILEPLCTCSCYAQIMIARGRHSEEAPVHRKCEAQLIHTNFC